MKIFDSHCHLYDDPDPDKVIYEAVEQGVTGFVVVGTSYETSAKTVEIVNSLRSKYPEIEIYSAIGLHPHDAKNSMDRIEDLIAETVADENNFLVAIGECGLDYYYNHSSEAEQKDVFSQQIELAKTYNLALIVHTREAWRDTFEVLDRQGAPRNTIIHCFTGSIAELDRCIKRGYAVSFSGIVTFKKSVELQSAAQACPIESLLIETDSPFLAPEPFRGKANSPKYVIEVVKKIAELKQMDPETVSIETYKNAKSAFNLN